MFRSILFIILTSLLFSSCQKTQLNDRTSKTFIATYEHLGSNKSFIVNLNLSSAVELKSGDLVAVATDASVDGIFIVILKTDEKGNKKWIKKYPVLRGPDTNKWNIVELEDGSLFISSRRTDEIMRVSPEGAVIYHTIFINDWQPSIIEAISKPLIQDDGSLYLSATYHTRQNDAYPTAQLLASIAPDGTANIMQRMQFDTAIWPLYIRHFNIVDLKDSTACYVCAVKWDILPPLSTGIFKLQQNALNDSAFLSRLVRLSPESQTIQGLSIIPSDRFGGVNVNGDEVSVLMHPPIPEIRFGSVVHDYFYFCKTSIDGNFSTVFKTIQNSGMTFVPNSFARSKDGGFYICGIINLGLSEERSFLIKLNSNLDIIYEKYDFDPTLRFNHISECQDGTLLLSGYTRFMGQGDESTTKRWLLCRLNADGSL